MMAWQGQGSHVLLFGSPAYTGREYKYSRQTNKHEEWKVFIILQRLQIICI